LGIELQKDQLILTPCFPMDWHSVNIDYRYGKSIYHINIFQLSYVTDSYWKKGAIEGKGNIIQLIDDGLEHTVEVTIGLLS
jgi:cyclic beta-1,2-glucan synthetase